MNTKSKAHGFTLVELSIVLVIIGLLIAGVLKGQQLYQNSKIVATVNEVHGIRAATTTFRDAYGALPGDLANGDVKIPGCTATCKNITGTLGYGWSGAASDGIVGSPDWGLWNTGGSNLSANSPISWVPQEATLFWAELSKAGFLSGVNGDATLNGAPLSFGVTNPAAPIGGGFVVGSGNPAPGGGNGEYYWTGRACAGDNYCDGSSFQFSGTVIGLITAANLPGGVFSQYTGSFPLTPLEAFQLDSKMDDGDPFNGSVEAYGVSSSCYNTDAATGGTPTGAYKQSLVSKDCGLYFTIEK